MDLQALEASFVRHLERKNSHNFLSMKNNSSADTKRLNDLRHAVDIACIVAVTDVKGFIVFVNDNFCKISGYTSGELIGEFYTVFDPSLHPCARQTSVDKKGSSDIQPLYKRKCS